MTRLVALPAALVVAALVVAHGAPGSGIAASCLVLVALGVAGRGLVQQHRRGRLRFRLVQFRPAAPFAGVLPAGRDRDRLAEELQARADAPAHLVDGLRRPAPGR
ncbi:hypothetical protein ACQP04_20665 [Pseudonocardia halophobica]|uniref:hypothetical protein n=1 Tax=Pseudonocardia halophobica TaxID=29401 RepID=UPI003D8FCE1F